MEDTASAQSLPQRFRVGLLVGAAREYVGRHRVLLAVVVVVVGGGAAAGGILATRSSYVATRPIQAALVRSFGGAGSTQYPRVLVQGGIPTIVRFVPHATFATSVWLRNKAGAPVTLERVRAVLPARAPLRQIGNRLFASQPFVCHSGSCPYVDPIGSPPFGAAERPVPLTVAPGHWALARLDFQFAACTSKPQQRGTTRGITVVYRAPDGTLIHQHVPLGNSTPRLSGIPQRATCR